MDPADLNIEPIPALSDNYIWLLHRGGPACAVVDPGEHDPVLDALVGRGLELTAILLTHHHWDHANGVPGLLAEHDVPVFGPDDDRLGDWCRPCREGDTVNLDALGLAFEVLDIPAHTRSHIAFTGHGLAFTGDTLFSVGCGRLFEGTPEDMQTALDKLAALPPETKIYCGHEYTLDNCRFALAVEPGNETLRTKANTVKAQRQAGHVTLPGTLAEELAANPFMRTRAPGVVAAARNRKPGAEPGASTMAVIRAWKDGY